MHLRSTIASALLLTCAPLSAQAAWSALYPSTSPGPRAEMLMASHDASQTIVLLWGFTGSTIQTDAWQFQGGTWSVMSGPMPPRRDQSAMVYDSMRQRLVLFGGYGGAPVSGVLDDTWEWDGAVWQQRSPAMRPPARQAHAMAFDPVRGVTVVFGGISNSPSFHQLHDTWEWDGVTWQQRFPAHEPSERYSASMAFDPRSRSVLLQGGRITQPAATYFADTWTFDGVDWQQQFPATPPPPRGDGGRMVSDPHRGRVLLVGGSIGDPAAWEWDGADWRAAYAGSPALRYLHGMCYDGAARRTLLYGGRVTGVTTFPIGDTWQFRTAQPADVTSFGAGCVGTAGTPTLANAPFEYPWLGDLVHTVVADVPVGEPGALFASSFGTTPPIDLTALGMSGCTLLVSPDVVEFAPALAGEATWALQLPNVLALSGAQFRQQAFVLDSAANALGLVASNAIEATVGVR